MERELEDWVEPLKERRIEVKPIRIERWPLDKTATDRIDVIGDGDSRVERSLGLDHPATRRNVARRVDGVAHVDPKLFQSLRPREQAAHADDRDCCVGMHYFDVEDSSSRMQKRYLAVIFVASFGRFPHDANGVDQAGQLANWVRFAKNVSRVPSLRNSFFQTGFAARPRKALQHKWVRFVEVFEGSYRVEIPVWWWLRLVISWSTTNRIPVSALTVISPDRGEPLACTPARSNE